MEIDTQSLHSLFDQLGLASDEHSIRKYCAENFLDEGINLADAAFFTLHQSQFLSEGWHHDADWAIVIDQLNANLSKQAENFALAKNHTRE